MIDRLLGKKVIGIKQSSKAIKNGEGICLYVAKDADEKLVLPLIKIAEESGMPVKYVETMKILGSMCGIEVKAATALVLE
ncbi:ribosomal L7Ae/L30e/S12e/Gadd45 family protein [Clostridium tarantellae]|uniref:50S ribosomal protein L7ae-like protein n=1 Tax=Clostridium tarantellae TaxID=39493 RepID=A0A6I1MGS8_9CLOT|nr:ribosomal L7Ae/L30e/S12e/Gadd45 family protein [Clostridium tarantellae]MPQ42380.1 50S ribosomal protein L7ae-like protein [Clostridium tarantellae]